MKLLLVSVKSQVSHGGITVWTDRFLKACEERDVECLLVNTELVGKRATQLSAKRNLSDELTRTRRIFRELKAQLKEKPEVAHINTSCGTFGLFRDYLVARKIRRAGVKLITHYHCDIPYWVKNSVSRFFLKKLAGGSHCNLVLNESSRTFLKEQYGIGSQLLPNYLEKEQIGEPKTQASPKLQSAIYVGRIEVAKGSRELYDTALRCPEIQFLLIGELSPDAKDWEVPENVQLLGAMPHGEVLKKLEEADVFFFPSHSEGCSVALIEAAARGLPMIATDVGANRDIVGKSGAVVAVGDVDAMVTALQQLDDPALRLQMSRDAVAHVHANYSVTQLDKLFAIIRELAK